MTLPRLEDIEEFPEDIWIIERVEARKYRAMRRQMRRYHLRRLWMRLRGKTPPAKPQFDW
ncbi:MAG TPA: hypothetical protein VN238_02630 [Solirubrobacteraceae bacterium]|nr:hypothetical protein [Solirubrobacteraceae bacterium]